MKLKIIKKTSIFMIIIVLCPLLMGCWNRRELNDLGIVGIMGVDIEGDKTKITLEVIDPKKGKNIQDLSASYIQVTGDSLFDAVRNVTLKYDRKLFFSHVKIYIFGEEVAKKGLVDYLDWCIRDHGPRMSGYILVAKGSSAEEVMGIRGGSEPIPTLYLEKMIYVQGASSKNQTTNILDFIKTYYSQGKQPVSGIIYKETNAPKEKNITKEILNSEGMAAFKNGKLVGYLNGTETKGFNYVTDKVKSGIITSKNEENKDLTAIEILKAKSKKAVELKDGNINIKIKVDIEGMLGDETEDLNIKDPKDIKKIEEKASEITKGEIQKAIVKAKDEFKTDIFGFGSIVRKKYPKEWKNMKSNWNEIFSDAAFEVEVNTKIIRTGLIDSPTNMKEAK